MNVEMFFVESDDVTAARAVVCERLLAPADPAGRQPDWSLPSSYDVLLADERKRKVALSPTERGWIAGVESKEILDFALLERLATQLRTRVVGVQLSDVSGSAGYAVNDRGVVGEHWFSEDHADPVGQTKAFLRRLGVPFEPLTFREAIQRRNAGWRIVAAADCTARAP